MPAKTYVAKLNLTPTGEEMPRDDDAPLPPATLRLTATADGVVIERSGLPLREGESVALTVTVIDDKVTIEERKGQVAALGGHEAFYNASQTVDFLPLEKIYIRYESRVAGKWAKFAFLNREGNSVEHQLGY